MPKTKFQNVIFTLMMAFLMVYAMICYNISLNIGGMSNQVFLMAFGEMKIMWPVAFLLEFFIVDKLAHALAFRIVTPNDRPIVITLAISAMIICIMCPVMSLIATVLFKMLVQTLFPHGFRPHFSISQSHFSGRCSTADLASASSLGKCFQRKKKLLPLMS